MPKRTRTQTYSFGASNRESHDATEFYSRSLYGNLPPLQVGGLTMQPRAVSAPSPVAQSDSALSSGLQALTPPAPGPLTDERWVNRIYCHTAEDMCHLPTGSVGLAFTSPPYNAGKDFDENLDLAGYLDLIRGVAAEVYRVLKPGGRYVVNIANLGRKPYIPLHAYFYAIHAGLGFLPAGEIIWQKGRGMNGSCAWGTWRSAKAPRLRDIHEYLLVFTKERFDRPDRGATEISAADFMAGTLSVWEIPPVSAKRIGHPAPFPVELAARVVRLFSYVGDVVLDPFCGSGTTCVAAVESGRQYVGYDIAAQYCDLSEQRIRSAHRDVQVEGA